MKTRGPFQLLGARFEFESNSGRLLTLVDAAYAGLPPQRVSKTVPRLKVRLLLNPARTARVQRRSEPAPLTMLAGRGILGGAAHGSNFVVVSPADRSALVVLSPQMLKFPYHTRYEFIEFAVFTLAARCQELISLHAASVGRGKRGVLLMGASGAGKSTLTLACLSQGLDIMSEDSAFVAPATMCATGVANFLHVRADSLRWFQGSGYARAIRNSPVIRRRSGVVKYEVDLRRGDFNLAKSTFKIVAVVFLSTRVAAGGPLLRFLPKAEARAKLSAAQAYAANQPGWADFASRIDEQNAFELRRSSHPLEAVTALSALL